MKWTGIIAGAFLVAASPELSRAQSAETKPPQEHGTSTTGKGDEQGGHMHGGQGGMGGMHGEGGMHGMMMGEGMSCSEMIGNADVKVENTSSGAVIRLTAKSKDQVKHVQQMAQMMKRCMSGERAAGPKAK